MAELLKKMLPDDRDYNTIAANYWLEYMEKLPELMQRGEINKAYEAIRFLAGEINSRSEFDGLWLCIFDYGERLEIVTNKESFKPRKKVVVSYLPLVGKSGKQGDVCFCR